MIKINFAHLCDDAFMLKDVDKANIFGIFRVIRGRTFPLQYPKITVVIGFTAAEEKEGEHKISLKMMREKDGKEITKMEIPINILKMEAYKKQGYLPVKQRREQEMNVIGHMEKITFEKPGEYSVKIFFDEEEIHSLPFWVRVSQK